MGKLKKVKMEIINYGLRHAIHHAFATIRNYYIFKVSFPAQKVFRKLIAWFKRNEPLNNTIIIESHNDFDCNGGAFYHYLIQNGYNKYYKIIWLVKNSITDELPNNVYAFSIFRFSLRKNYHIATASYLLSDDYITDKVRKDQISIYCTHGGITFKNVKGLIVMPKSVDYILSSSEQYDPYLCQNYSIEYPNKKMLHLGYPSNDILFENKRLKIMRFLGKPYQKIILWMPTFRKSKGVSHRSDSNKELPFGIPLIETEEQAYKVNQFLMAQNAVLLIKLHPMQDLEGIGSLEDYKNMIVLSGSRIKEVGIDTYELMSVADALISDYSASSYSYMLKNRPIGFVLSDLNDYKLGFSVPNMEDFLPGNKIYQLTDLINFIKYAVDEDPYRYEREKLLDYLYEYQDGNACKRLAEFLNLKKEK